jgi:cytochrome c peroxidase
MTIRLVDEGGAEVPTRRSAQMGLVNLAPEAELGVQQTYRVIVDGVRDFAGNRAPRFEGTFTTGTGAQAFAPTAAVTDVDRGLGLGRYALGIFEAGRRVYSDRTYTFTATHPARYDGQAYIQTANVDRGNFTSNFLRFELLAPAEVIVLYDARASRTPNWMSGFMANGESVVTTDVPLNAYTRRFAAGSVALGGNSASGASGAQSMYSVVIIPDPVPCEVELSPVQSGTVTLSARGPVNGTYQWRVGGRTLTGSAPRVYLPPGRHPIALTVRDGPLGASCGGVKIAHRPLVTEPARVASRLVWSGGHTFSVNDDDASVVRVDPATQRRVWLHALGGGEPTTLAVEAGEVYVVDRAGAQLVVLALDDGRELRRVRFPYGSAPYGLVFDPQGRGYVTLSGTGELVRLARDGTVEARAAVVPTARGLTWFDGRLYVTRFISPDDRGEVHVLDAATLAPRGVVALPFDRGPDTEASGRGVPNYVAEVQIAPDGARGYVASKKDNIARGLARDGQALTFETRVRTIVSPFVVATSSAPLSARLDVNDRDLVLTTLVSPYADLLFVASQGANVVDVFDVQQGRRVSQFEVGRAPTAMALDAARGRLAVLNSLSREVSYYDVADLLAGRRNAVTRVAQVSTVEREVLDALVLEGKRLFHDASDDRMSRDNYISCASCHFEGGEDGRTWDFTQSGEGLRNTIALAGRGGAAHGRVHWTANFDEVQDFENDIRLAFGGTGFLTDADFMLTRDPLGAPKAGRSRALDALAAYVATLTRFPASPYRSADGALTEAARRGREVFTSVGCARCHAGEAFTDRARHDVGTIRATSGLGLGAPLAGVGFDTPTLRSVWSTPPYLHDGSARTMEEVLARHGEIPPLSMEARADLARYLLELDGTSLAPEVPCDRGPNECVGGAVAPGEDAGVAADGAVGSADVGADVGAADGGADGGASGADAGVDAPEMPAPDPAGGCGCTTSGGAEAGALASLLCTFVLLGRRRPRS